MIIKRSKMPTILGIVILVAAVFLGVFAVNYQQIFRLGASSESEPKDIRVTNITDNSVTISWTTDKESLGFVILDNKSEGETTTPSATHSVTVTGLKPITSYQYKINSDGVLFDNKGIAWQTITGTEIGINKNSQLISGSVLTATGQPVKKALVYANIGGYLLSTLTSDTGNFIFQLASARTQDLKSYLEISPTQTMVELSVNAGPQGVSSAQVLPQSGNPTPPLILGQTHDFKNLPPPSDGQIPNASLSLPTEIEKTSKFSVPENLSTPTSETVTLQSIDEGELVTSTTPEFFGTGPEGETLTIKVESESPQTEEIKVSSGGSWKWTPPAGLAAGVHKVTVTWIDASGIARSLTRNFVVQAAEGPAFEASNSAQTQTASPAPSKSPTPTPISSAVATSSATIAPVPETGSLTPTMLLSIMGMGVIALSFAIWKYADA